MNKVLKLQKENIIGVSIDEFIFDHFLWFIFQFSYGNLVKYPLAWLNVMRIVSKDIPSFNLHHILQFLLLFIFIFVKCNSISVANINDDK